MANDTTTVGWTTASGHAVEITIRIIPACTDLGNTRDGDYRVDMSVRAAGKYQGAHLEAPCPEAIKVGAVAQCGALCINRERMDMVQAALDAANADPRVAGTVARRREARARWEREEAAYQAGAARVARAMGV